MKDIWRTWMMLRALAVMGPVTLGWRFTLIGVIKTSDYLPDGTR